MATGRQPGHTAEKRKVRYSNGRPGTRWSAHRPCQPSLPHTWLWCLIGLETHPFNFPPVSAGEMAFALTVFVNAANRRILPRVTPELALTEDGNEVCKDLYQTLCADVSSLPTMGRPRPDDETTLFGAFLVLCLHYEGHAEQASLCARVLAFYFLMERSAGAALAGWVRPSPDDPRQVLLDPAVIRAIASVRLERGVLLSASHFLELVSAASQEL